MQYSDRQREDSEGEIDVGEAMCAKKQGHPRAEIHVTA